jgi:hypothetical protein
MSFTHAISEDGSYLRITVAGAFSLSIAEAMIGELLPVALQAGVFKVLVDVRLQERQLDTLSAHEIGIALVQPALRHFAIAVLTPDPLALPHHIETVANNRGGNVRYFNDEGAALAWLGVSSRGQ